MAWQAQDAVATNSASAVDKVTFGCFLDDQALVEIGIQPQPIIEQEAGSKGTGDEESETEQIPVEAPTISREDKIKNAKVLSLIQGALTDELFPRIRNEKIAKSAWEILRREFRGDKKVRAVKLQAIRADFEYLRMNDVESLDDYLARFFETVNNLKSLGEDVTEKRIVQKLLMSLSRGYKSIVSITEVPETLTLLELKKFLHLSKSMIRERIYMMKGINWQELRKLLAVSELEIIKLLQLTKVLRESKIKNGKDRTKRAQTGLKVETLTTIVAQIGVMALEGIGTTVSIHKTSKEIAVKVVHKGKPRCGKCNRFGHTTKDCDNGKQVANCAKEEEVTTMFYACHASSIASSKSMWFVDSACSNHMTSQESLLINLDRSVTCKVKMGTSDLVQATGKGILVVETRKGRRYINEVLSVPGLDENLLSVGQMMEHGYYILFGGNYALICDDSSLDNVVAKVAMAGNRCSPLSMESVCSMGMKAAVQEDSWVWHRRLGHLNFASMKKMQQTQRTI
ncbi:PREDICTED: uncharacterized protein LOC107880366 [Prunus mume]|uniref:Uncharacterized protein LOC107880366 n=1 Tax=Prunus mume TaxID=102107 RepID=A0ABM1LIC3_PRUMU|nr:PREDICTED: uncharacterized protein LOC107880366 [Prunus mume]